MTSFLTLPADRAAAVRKALRENAGKFIARYYRHDVLRARAVKGVQAEAVDEFQRVIVAPLLREVAASLATFDQRGPGVIIDQFPDLRRLQAEVVGIVSRGAGAVKALADNRLADLTHNEVEWARDTAAKVLRVQVPTLPDLHRVSQDRPFLGQRFDGWFRDMLTQPAAKNAIQWIQTGLNTGLSTDQIVRGLRGTPSSGYTDGWLTGSGRDLATLVRTAATHFASTTNTETFKALGFDSYRWLATLDTRTCPVCGELDGSVFKLGEGPIPPSHANCRCATIMWMGEPEGTRASQDGPVPADREFEDWLQSQSIAEQNDVLGRTKAAAWRAGDLPLAKMIGSDMQVLTISELRRLDRLPPEPDDG